MEGAFQFTNELPSVEGIAQVDETGRTVDDGQWQLLECCEELGWFLVWIHTVAQCQLRHAGRVLFAEVIGNGFVVLGRVGERLQG